MAVNRVPVLKRCRSLGLEPTVLGIDKKSTRELKRSSRKVSEYGLQLREKQKAKFIYGVLEKPFRNYYERADRMKGQTGENLMIMLESRLDNVVFRLGYKDIVEATGGRLVPEWLESDLEALKGTVKELPSRDAIDVPVNEMLIVELYSK